MKKRLAEKKVKKREEKKALKLKLQKEFDEDEQIKK